LRDKALIHLDTSGLKSLIIEDPATIHRQLCLQ